MSKVVLISIRPEWCEKIASGEKTIEVRKTRPKLRTPFRCYIYCTKSDDANRLRGSQGKIIGEFTCDLMYELETKAPGGSYYVKNEDQTTTNFIARQSGLDFKDMHDYLHAQKGYGWRITDLRIYDAPRELSEFTGLRNTRFGAEPYDIKRPPQSWCYVEAMEAGETE